MYHLEYSKDSKNDLSKLPKKEISKILRKIELLQENPRMNGVEALKGKYFKGCYRIRIGNYRIIYEVIDKKMIVYIIRIAKRGEVYEK